MSRVIIAALGVGLFWTALWSGPHVVQPIEFPHKTHVALSLECTSCHERADKDAVAGRPATPLCLTCHGTGGDTAELKKLRALAAAGEIPWRRVWRLPPHVFFSHRVHVAVGRVPCQTCHGPMETLERPPARPLKTLTMNDCIGCHEARQRRVEATATREITGQRSMSTDCTACHR